ncbi:MAG: hypothetical protein ACFFDN_33045 [Candidatus Hodarchaeota archaeon]
MQKKEVVKIKEILYKGTIQGLVTSTDPHIGFSRGYAFLSFIMKSDTNIEGIPEEFPVLGEKTIKSEYLINTHVREGDIVHVTGNIIRYWLKHWKTKVVWMKAKHIFNETLNFGY